MFVTVAQEQDSGASQSLLEFVSKKRGPLVCGLQPPSGGISHLCALAWDEVSCDHVLQDIDTGLPSEMHRDKCAGRPSGLRAFVQGFTVARSCSPASVVLKLSHLPASPAWGALPLTPHLSFLSCAGPRGRSTASPGIAVHTRTAHL